MYKRQAVRGELVDGFTLPAPDAGSEGMPGIIIPRKTVAELQKLGDDPDMIMTVELSDSKIRFTIGSVVLTSKVG